MNSDTDENSAIPTANNNNSENKLFNKDSATTCNPFSTSANNSVTIWYHRIDIWCILLLETFTVFTIVSLTNWTGK